MTPPSVPLSAQICGYGLTAEVVGGTVRLPAFFSRSYPKFRHACLPLVDGEQTVSTDDLAAA
ncbi:hypothetical protein Asp14428_48610 [Actinoplanes sp. NBRC 14428]|nr:hypothetical protein Asp14428_48610 [Actinoplanes sp. NBRC 14428]